MILVREKKRYVTTSFTNSSNKPTHHQCLKGWINLSTKIEPLRQTIFFIVYAANKTCCRFRECMQGYLPFRTKNSIYFNFKYSEMDVFKDPCPLMDIA